MNRIIVAHSTDTTFKMLSTFEELLIPFTMEGGLEVCGNLVFYSIEKGDCYYLKESDHILINGQIEGYIYWIGPYIKDFYSIYQFKKGIRDGISLDMFPLNARYQIVKNGETIDVLHYQRNKGLEVF